MSRRNRGSSGNTYVNNVRGPTSALTSFLNERGIRRANPAPAPQVSPPPAPEADQTQQEQAEEDQPAAASSSSSRTTRTVRLTRGRSITTSTAAASSSRAAAGAEDEEDDSDEDSDDEDSDDDVVPVTISRRSTRTTRVQASSSKSAASMSKVAAAAKAKAKAAAAAGEDAGPSKKRRKKDASDDSNDEDFHDITGYVSRSRFSHKGRMPQGSNKIEFCSRCRARFTVKAGSTPAVDEDSGGLLCPTCGTSDASSAAPKPKPVKRARRQQQKAEIENRVPSLQDLCIQKIASCIEDVEAFGDISDISMDKICRIICRNRSLNTDTVQLFFDSRHSDLTLYDCTDITADGLRNIAQFCPNLRSLKLKLCGRIDNSVMDYYSEHLTRLTSLSLQGPIMVTEASYIKLFEAVGARFERFELKHSSRFTLKALNVLCEKCPKLKYLRLGDINLMDDDWLEPMANLTLLKSLRLRNPERGRITTAAVVKLLQAVGSGLEELELKGCVALENPVLVEGIRPSCVRLERLNIAECEEFTTEGVETLFRDWTTNRGLNYINLENCMMLKDDALKAITAHSGASLEDLNIKGLDELTKESLLTLALCENLKTLDASWCRAMDDEVMEGLVKGAPKLQKVAVWGDHRLTECCPTKKGMKIIGREGDYIDLKFL
ncbi:hypothetical protein BGX34_010754 [Mortierella sp. NVP85]|nr:hypothetical protein BGX34_010754 [Mortierella sp. NVP85]